MWITWKEQLVWITYNSSCTQQLVCNLCELHTYNKDLALVWLFSCVTSGITALCWEWYTTQITPDMVLLWSLTTGRHKRGRQIVYSTGQTTEWTTLVLGRGLQCTFIWTLSDFSLFWTLSDFYFCADCPQTKTGNEWGGFLWALHEGAYHNPRKTLQWGWAGWVHWRTWKVRPHNKLLVCYI